MEKNEATAMLIRLAAIKEQIAELEKKEEKIRKAIIDEYGNDIDTPWFSFKKGKPSKRTQWKLVVADAHVPQEVIDKYTTVGEPVWRFTIKEAFREE